MTDAPHAYIGGTVDYGDYDTVDLCTECGREVGPENKSGLCRRCAQIKRRKAEEEALSRRRLINHRKHKVGELARAWWAATEPQPMPEHVRYLLELNQQVRRAVAELRRAEREVA